MSIKYVLIIFLKTYVECIKLKKKEPPNLLKINKKKIRMTKLLR